MSHVPPEQIAATPPTSDNEGRAGAAVVWLLYLLAIPSANLFAVVGVIAAYVLREGNTGWARTHYDAQIRLFWSVIVWFIVLTAVIVVSALFSLILIGIPFLIAAGLAMLVLAVWFVVRSVVGLVRVMDSRPMS